MLTTTTTTPSMARVLQLLFVKGKKERKRFNFFFQINSQFVVFIVCAWFVKDLATFQVFAHSSTSCCQTLVRRCSKRMHINVSFSLLFFFLFYSFIFFFFLFNMKFHFMVLLWRAACFLMNDSFPINNYERLFFFSFHCLLLQRIVLLFFPFSLFKNERKVCFEFCVSFAVHSVFLIFCPLFNFVLFFLLKDFQMHFKWRTNERIGLVLLCVLPWE